MKMKPLFVLFTLWITSLAGFAQQQALVITIKDSLTKEPLPGVAVSIGKTGQVSDLNGQVKFFLNSADLPLNVKFQLLGYVEINKTVNINDLKLGTLEIKLPASHMEIEEVIISSDRTGNRIEDAPTRIEVLGGDEVDEKSAMLPGNISMMLTEYTGIQAQQTSVTSGNINLKVQGLNGKYAQILKDGFPIYGGFSGNLGLMEIPPLDLKQVEIIKGSASTLYGADAISGMINLISRKPGPERSNTLLLNQTSLKGTDLAFFSASAKRKTSYTLLFTGSRQSAMDVDGDGIADLNKTHQLTFNPRIFLYPKDSTEIMIGLNSSYDKRIGGDMIAINDADSSHRYTDQNISVRNYSQMKFTKIKNGIRWEVKNSLSQYSRKEDVLNNYFTGSQFSSFTEFSFTNRIKGNNFLLGANLYTDEFRETNSYGATDRGFSRYTPGLFTQSDMKISEKFTLQNGLRIDYNTTFKTYVLPRISFIFKINKALTIRSNTGAGYKLPFIFSEESNAGAAYFYLKPNPDLIPEESRGSTMDLNFSHLFGSTLSLNLNQAVFITEILNPLVLKTDKGNGTIYYANSKGSIVARGLETNINMYVGELNIILAYTFTHSMDDSTHLQAALTPAHKAMIDLLYDLEGKWKIGAEGFYTGTQKVVNGEMRPDYWILGLLIQKIFDRTTLTLNFENLLNYRMQNFESIFTESISKPQFKEIWAPLTGRSINFSIKYRF